MGLGQSNFLFQLSVAVIGQTTLSFHENAHKYSSLPLQHPPKPIKSPCPGSTVLWKVRTCNHSIVLKPQRTLICMAFSLLLNHIKCDGIFSSVTSYRNKTEYGFLNATSRLSHGVWCGLMDVRMCLMAFTVKGGDADNCSPVFYCTWSCQQEPVCSLCPEPDEFSSQYQLVF
jgi:hypothetical protein